MNVISRISNALSIAVPSAETIAQVKTALSSDFAVGCAGVAAGSSVLYILAKTLFSSKQKVAQKPAQAVAQAPVRSTVTIGRLLGLCGATAAITAVVMNSILQLDAKTIVEKK